MLAIVWLMSLQIRRSAQKANVGSGKKAQNATNFTLYDMVLLRGFLVMNIFPHLLAPLKVATIFFE